MAIELNSNAFLNEPALKQSAVNEEHKVVWLQISFKSLCYYQLRLFEQQKQ